MQQAHYALYAKTAPDAGLDWNAEAFKVVDGQAIPKTPFQIQPPAGVPQWTPACQGVGQCESRRDQAAGRRDRKSILLRGL